jgi:hypothetical protein
MTLKINNLTPGSCVSADHYFSPIQGRLPHILGQEKIGYTCGSLFVDHASRKIFNFPQYSNTADETIKSAMKLEALAHDEGFKIKKYHSDNGIFSSNEFKAHCNHQQTNHSFSGVGAKHMNGIAERNIKTVAQWARANMLHLAHSWPQYADPKYWPQAINYATWVFNNLPNMESGIRPNEVWSNVRNSDDIFQRAHAFGCPVYVLDALLQDGKKIPKWSPCARLGLFLGFSEVHSSQVPLMLNVETKKISPQFHVIFDDTFQTVHSLPSDKPIHAQWEDILKFDRECFAEMDYDKNGEPILPLLSNIMKTFRNKREQRQLQAPLTPLSAARRNDNIITPVDTHVPLPQIRDENTLAPPATNESSVTHIPPHNNLSSFPVEDNTVTGGEDAVPGGEDAVTDTGRPRWNVGTYKDGPDKNLEATN